MQMAPPMGIAPGLSPPQAPGMVMPAQGMVMQRPGMVPQQGMVLLPPGMVPAQPMGLQPQGMVPAAPQMMQAPPGILQAPAGMGLTGGMVQAAPAISPGPAQPPAESGDDRLKKSIAQLTKFFE
jgi:hypothetical protein